MIQSTPSFIITYRALNHHGEWEDGTALSPVPDYSKYLKSLGYRNIEILGARQK